MKFINLGMVLIRRITKSTSKGIVLIPCPIRSGICLRNDIALKTIAQKTIKRDIRVLAPCISMEASFQISLIVFLSSSISTVGSGRNGTCGCGVPGMGSSIGTGSG